MVTTNSIAVTDDYFEKIILLNGSELEGYTSTQTPGEGFVFSSSRALICLNKSDVISINNREVPISQLTPQWRDWAVKNDAYKGIGDNRFITLSDIVTKDKTLNNVRLIANGTVIKYLELSSNTYLLSWDSLKQVLRSKRSKIQMSGINYDIQYIGGVETIGQCIEQLPGKTISILPTNNITEVIDVNKITKQRFVPVNSNQTLYEQSRFTDEIILKNGTIVRGIITENNYGAKDLENYIVVTDEYNTSQMIVLNTIAKYNKILNPKYKPLFDVLLNVNEVQIDHKPTRETITNEQQIRNQHYIVLNSDSCSTMLELDSLKSGLILEANFGDDNQSRNMTLLPCNKYYKIKKNYYVCFSYEEMFKNAIMPISNIISANNTTKVVYPIKMAGLYVVYFAKKNKAILISVKK